ncbi:MAG: hypothetical protein C0601_00970 [Candidatus Muiribacterium halophilum]|uniref:Type II secretion system protein GspG C-terminal domain-containing protein n=1 Tax=Muiribacterium halophilum TaxID=2053465 RepID=A0A2N5ZM60_MUIH1|nr:MAG: hypothetical protein C0601_00970 [Candidatus Muirbacterium halophilum]
MKRLKVNKKAFTLIELVFAVAILALVSVYAVPWIFDSMRGAKENTLKYNLYSIRQAINRFYDEKESYPRSLDVLVMKGYLQKLPIDPTTGKADWEIAVNRWDDNAEDYIEKWVFDTNLGGGPNYKWADGGNFIAPVITSDPYRDMLPSDNQEVYRSLAGIRNIRSHKRYNYLGGPVLSNDPKMDWNHSWMGRPTYQFFKTYTENYEGVNNTPWDMDAYPVYIIENALGVLLGDVVPSSALTQYNFPDKKYLFDQYAGNYWFRSADPKKQAERLAQDVAIAGVSSYYD